MTERGGGPPSSQQSRSGANTTNIAHQNTNHSSQSSPSKRFLAAENHHHNPYNHGQINDRKQSQMQQQFQTSSQYHSTMQQFGTSNALQAQSSNVSSQHQHANNIAAASYSSGNNAPQQPAHQQLQVSSDLKLMNLTQAQINVSKMIQSRDSEAARKALEMSKQVQSNTMLVSDQIARIQHQVQMQKQKANKAAAEEHFYHHPPQYHHSGVNPQQQQQHHHQHHQHQQMLQRNPLSGTIQMNVKNSMSKPVQPQPYNAGGVASGQMVQSPLIGAQAASNKINHLVQPPQQQYMSQPQASTAAQHQPQFHQQQYATAATDSASTTNNAAVANSGNMPLHQRKAVNQSDLLKSKQSMGGDRDHQQHQYGQSTNLNTSNTSATANNAAASNANAAIVRISKKPSSYSGGHHHVNHHRQHKQAAPAADHQTSPPGVASGTNSKLIKLKAPQVQTLNNQQHSTTVSKQQTTTPAVSVTNTNASQQQNQAEQGQLEENSGTNRIRPSYPSQLSQQLHQQHPHQATNNQIKVRPMGGQEASSKDNRRKASLGLKELRDQNQQHHLQPDIMPAQQSNISAEDLDDDEGRIKEIPRQSVLSNLVESSISNFENEESVEDGVNSDKAGIVNTSQKNIIRIEKQGSIDTGSKQHHNLKSRKSQKQDHVVRRNMMLANGAAANQGKSGNKQRKRIVDEPIVVNSVHDVGGHQNDRAEKNSSIHRRKDIDSDNKSEVSDEDDNEQAEVRSGIRKRKQNSIMALRRKKMQQDQLQHQRQDKNNTSQVSSSTKKPHQAGNPTVIALNAGALASNANNSQDPIEIRGVETIEEFFRPEFAQNTQSLDDINDDSDNRSDDDNVTDGGGIVKMMSGLDGGNGNGNAEKKNHHRAGSKLNQKSASSKMAPFPPFSDDNDGSGLPSSDSDGSQVDIGKDHNKAQFRNMGFPNMNYLDPEANGPPLQTQTYYKNFEEDQDNDVKVKREEMSNARDNMPNNTFIKLFHFLNADAGEAGATNAAPGGADTEDDHHHLNERNAYGGANNFDSGNQGGGPRGNKQDELQSIQYVDVNYVESSMETDNEAAMANFNREIASPAGGDVRIIYNPAKNKSKSLGRVGLADQLNQFHSMNQDGSAAANPNSQLRQRKGSMLGGSGVSDKNNQSHGRRQRIKANSSEKLPPLLSNKNITATENGSGSRKRLIQPPEIGGHHSEKGPSGGGNQSRQKTRAVMHAANEGTNQDSQASIFLKQALGNDLVPINFEMKGAAARATKQQLGEVSAKARLNGNLTTINGGGAQNEGMHQRHMQEQHLKSSSNPSLRPNQGRSGSINVDLVAKHSISTSNNQGVVVGGSKHPKMSFMTSDHQMYQHHHHNQGGFLSPQQQQATDQDSNLPPILKNQENYFSRNGVINQVNSGQQQTGAPNGTGGPVESVGGGVPVGSHSHQKHFGMMHKRIENQHHYQGVFSGGAVGAGQGPQHHQGPQIVSNFMTPNNALQLQQSPPGGANGQHSQQQTASNSPTNRNTAAEAGGSHSHHQQVQQPFFNQRAPIKAFPQHQTDNSQQEEVAQQPAGEEEMQEFVNDFERATLTEKAHEQMLCLKKIRLHHKVLAKISFNAYKFVIEYSQVIKVRQGETLFAQGNSIDQIYFVLYGALMVTIQQGGGGTTSNKSQRVGDVVRGGNVLGEEAFFCPDAVYKETAVAHTAEVGLIQVDAAMLSGLGSDNFKGKGQNMLAYQRDFRALFQVLKEIYGTKEAWRSRAQSLLAKQSYNLKIINLD